MINKIKEAGVSAPTSSTNLLTTNQLTVYKNNYKSNSEIERRKFEYFCSFCGKILSDDSITFRGISACPDCLQSWAKLTSYLHEHQAIQRRPRLIRLFQCFFCEQHFASEKMSACLTICKICRLSIHEKDGREKERVIEQTLLKIANFVRRRI